MPNTFEYATWLAMESLDLLESKRAVSQYFNTDYSKEFKLKFPVGDAISVPYPQRFTIRNGLTYNPQAINRIHASISFNDPFGIDFDWDSAEQALKAPRGRAKVSKEILEPAMSYLAQEIDSRCAQYAYQNAASVAGSLATDPADFDSATGAAAQKMFELGCPEGEKAFLLSPALNRTLKKTAVAWMNPVSDVSKMFRKGIVGQADDFDFYRSMSLYRHTAGTWAGAVTVTSTMTTDGNTSLAVTCTNGDTFKKGDKISIANVLPVNPMTRRTFGSSAKTFTITADATGASSAATLAISPAIYGPNSQYQNVNALPQASAALTLWPGTSSPNGKAGTVTLALHRNAFALVGVELEEPKDSSVELVSQKRDPDSGISVRFIRQWDNTLSRFTNRFDACIGLGSFYNDACAVAVAGA